MSSRAATPGGAASKPILSVWLHRQTLLHAAREGARVKSLQMSPAGGGGGSIYVSGYGGVGVIVREGIPARVCVPGATDSAVRRRLWDSQRWVHVEVAYGDGGRLLIEGGCMGARSSATCSHACAEWVFRRPDFRWSVPNAPPPRSEELRGTVAALASTSRVSRPSAACPRPSVRGLGSNVETP